ncbi:MAG: galactokinase family protein [Desulfurococcaceae archaeon]
MVKVKASNIVKEEFRKIYHRDPELVTSAPGRLDFLNTHQDYKGLPVVSIAINKRIYIAVSKSDSESTVYSVNLCKESMECVDRFDPEHTTLMGNGWFGDYIRSVVKTLRDRGIGVGGFHMLIYSEIPIGSGLASSAALQVSAIKALAEIHGIELTQSEIAELAYISEHDVMGIPCGRLDQYGSAMGGITLIETRPPFKTKTYRDTWFKLVAINSGIKHSTGMIHPVRIKELMDGIRELLFSDKIPRRIKELLHEDIYRTRWNEINYDEIAPFLDSISTVSKKRIAFTLKMHYSTVLALNLLEKPSFENIHVIEEFLIKECPLCLNEASRTNNRALVALSGIVNYQHVLLRDLYDVSLPELEEIRRKAIDAGSLGVKISGAGLGGALLAIVDSYEIGNRVIEEVREISKGAWLVDVEEGVRVDS